MGIADSIIACVIAAEAILEEPKPLWAIIAETFFTAGEAQAGNWVPDWTALNNSSNW